MLTNLEKHSRGHKRSAMPTMLSDQERDDIDHEIAKVPLKRHACLDALLVVQKYRGYVSDDALVAVAEYLEMSATELDGIATFYNLIYRKPVGRHVIRLCDSISCHIMGYQQIKKALCDQLQIEFGETSSDDAFTLLPAQCLGVCHQAPAMMINEETHTDLNEDKAIRLITERRKV